MTQQRTYGHLEHLNRKPTDYEIASTKLLYHPDRGFEVKVPLEDWYRKYVTESPFTVLHGDRFADPRETTYAKYVAIQKDKEIYVNGLLQAMEEAQTDRSLSGPWRATWSRLVSSLRFPVHGLQMAAAYVGQMAPGSRIAIAALFQSADEIRRVQRLAYRLRLLQVTHADGGQEGRRDWERDPRWQPLRHLVEELLVTFDWGEAFVALNLAAKPVLDEFFMVHFGRVADRAGDPMLGKLLLSLNEDCRWHRQWSAARGRAAHQENPRNRAVVEGWIRRWRPRALDAIRPFASLFEEDPASPRASEFPALVRGIDAACQEYWRSADLSGPWE
jgi:toluene monooxygenase system protein E